MTIFLVVVTEISAVARPITNIARLANFQLLIFIMPGRLLIGVFQVLLQLPQMLAMQFLLLEDLIEVLLLLGQLVYLCCRYNPYQCYNLYFYILH